MALAASRLCEQIRDLLCFVSRSLQMLPTETLRRPGVCVPHCRTPPLEMQIVHTCFRSHLQSGRLAKDFICVGGCILF
jgi:hypothetical protein